MYIYYTYILQNTDVCVNMHDLAMHAEWNRWSYAIGAAYHNYTYDPPKKLVEQVGKIIYKMNGNVGMAGW